MPAKISKYTPDELEAYKAHVRDIINNYKNYKAIMPKGSESLENIDTRLHVLSEDWNTVKGNIIESKIDSTMFPFKVKDSAIKYLEKYQLKAFPLLRKAFCRESDKKLWIEDCHAYISGDDDEFITLTGNYFLPNANKQSTYNTLLPQLQRLRFKMLVFRWFKGYSGEPTGYQIKSDFDDDWFTYN
jgi:hypothetical protein